MNIKDTLTYKDIAEIPALLARFSSRAGEIKKLAIRSSDKTVYLVGRGSSGTATLFAKYIWETYAGTVTNFIHPHSIFEARRPLHFAGQAVWAFSQSGRSQDIVACLEKLLKWGAKGVAVTNEPDLKRNPLARLAGRHILLSYSKEVPVAATKSFELQLWAVLWAAQAWSGCFGDRDFKDAVDAAARAVKENYGGDKLIAQIKKAHMLGFVGRGPYNAVAEDSALKFREMAKAHALGYSAAEFLHGPVGAYTSKDLVFLFSPSDRTPEDIMKVKRALKERGTPYHVIKPGSLKMPFSCIPTDIRMKKLALRLSLAKGLNPDNPKGLNKVTQTF
ncbi:MAG: SIS domain-containing protein [Elusimicrobiales bacterium]|nr:SIS domain-containing protein [Elusimicrobiales bacterium]